MKNQVEKIVELLISEATSTRNLVRNIYMIRNNPAITDLAVYLYNGYYDCNKESIRVAIDRFRALYSYIDEETKVACKPTKTGATTTYEALTYAGTLYDAIGNFLAGADRSPRKRVTIGAVYNKEGVAIAEEEAAKIATEEAAKKEAATKKAAATKKEKVYKEASIIELLEEALKKATSEEVKKAIAEAIRLS